MKAPSIIPCIRAAIPDPAENAQSHKIRDCVARKRNSKATPRKTSASETATMRAKTRGRSSATRFLRRCSRRRGVLSGAHSARFLLGTRGLRPVEDDAHGKIEEGHQQDQIPRDKQREGARHSRG